MNIVHSPRELIKITQMKDGAIYSTRSLGLWYVPMGTNFKNDLITKAKEFFSAFPLLTRTPAVSALSKTRFPRYRDPSRATGRASRLEH